MCPVIRVTPEIYSRLENLATGFDNHSNVMLKLLDSYEGKMSKTEIASVVTIFEKKFGVHLSRMPRKKIIYDGKTKSGKTIVVVMPESKIYPAGNGWVDFTKIQIDISKQYQIAIAVFRLSDGATYWINLSDFSSMLTKENIMENEIEGEHWKMDIWPNKIVIRNGGETLYVKPNENEFIYQLV